MKISHFNIFVILFSLKHFFTKFFRIYIEFQVSDKEKCTHEKFTLVPEAYNVTWN